RLARSLEPHRSGRRPGNGVALRVGDGDGCIIERRIHMRDAGRDVLALTTTDARSGGFLAHCKPFPEISTPPYHQRLHLKANAERRTKAVRHSLFAISKLISSCPRSPSPDPCECARWYVYAGRAPA